MALYVVCPQKKIISRNFKISGALIVNILAAQNKLVAKIQVTEQYLAKCPKRLQFPLYKSNYSKTPFPSTLLNAILVKYGPKNLFKNKVI
jgi:hypothetical protein